jgi:hypothetical protein
MAISVRTLAPLSALRLTYGSFYQTIIAALSGRNKKGKHGTPACPSFSLSAPAERKKQNKLME